MSRKLFKLYRSSDASVVDNAADEATLYSLDDVLLQKKGFLEDKVFQLITTDNKENKFKYVYLKVK